MTDLLSVFSELMPSLKDGSSMSTYVGFRIAESDRHYISKSEQGHPVLLIETCLPVGTYPSPLKLENLTVQHGCVGTVKSVECEVTGVFSIVECRVNDDSLIGSFIRLSSHLLRDLPDLPEPRAVTMEFRKLVHIFKALLQPPSKTIQGLWAELFVLANSPDLRRWADAWHEDPLERYDFSMQRIRVEVKSSGNRIRSHHFSHEQLHPPSDINLWIASVFVERSTGGSDCLELLWRIQSRIESDLSFNVEAKVLRALGADYTKVRTFKFDDELAKDSLLFIPVEAIPRLPDDFPDDISEIRYRVHIPASEHSQGDYPRI